MAKTMPAELRQNRQTPNLASVAGTICPLITKSSLIKRKIAAANENNANPLNTNMPVRKPKREVKDGFIVRIKLGQLNSQRNKNVACHSSSSTRREFEVCCGWSKTTQPRSGIFRQAPRRIERKGARASFPLVCLGGQGRPAQSNAHQRNHQGNLAARGAERSRRALRPDVAPSVRRNTGGEIILNPSRD